MLYLHRSEFSDEGDRAVSETCCGLLYRPDENLRCCMLDVEHFCEECVELFFCIDAIPDYGEEGPDFRSVFGTAALNGYIR